MPTLCFLVFTKESNFFQSQFHQDGQIDVTSRELFVEEDRRCNRFGENIIHKTPSQTAPSFTIIKILSKTDFTGNPGALFISNTKVIRISREQII